MFLYNDRKEDKDLPVGAIEKAILDGVISEDIVKTFKHKLNKGLDFTKVSRKEK